MREQPRREHVQLARAGPADDVAARRGRGEAARDRQPRLRGVELRDRGVQDDRELAGARVEALLEPRAGELELRQHARGVLLVALVVAREEGLGGGVDPGHGADYRSWTPAGPVPPGEAFVPVSSRQARRDLDGEQGELQLLAVEDPADHRGRRDDVRGHEELGAERPADRGYSPGIFVGSSLCWLTPAR